MAGPLGTVSSLAAKGITNTGSYRPTRNGPVVTAGGLIFMAQRRTGMSAPTTKTTAGSCGSGRFRLNPDGLPAVYEANGRQYVAFYAGTAANTTESHGTQANRKRKATTSSP